MAAVVRLYAVELTGENISIIGGALSAQLRYFQRGLDKAKEDEAVDRWARACVQLGRAQDSLAGAVLIPKGGS